MASPKGYYQRNKARLRKYYQDYRDHNRDAIREYNTKWKRIWSRRRLYGLTEEHFQHLLAEQLDKCAICEYRPDNPHLLNVDHNHVAGHIRGLLCGRCNRVLGQVQDDVVVLQAAIEYLKRQAL